MENNVLVPGPELESAHSMSGDSGMSEVALTDVIGLFWFGTVEVEERAGVSECASSETQSASCSKLDGSRAPEIFMSKT